MNALKHFRILSISLLLAAGLAACDNPGPAETAGKKLDDAANRTGLKIGETIDHVGEKLGEKSDKAGIALDDAAITAKVKSAIYAERGLKTLRISVDTKNGVVTLTGSVDSQAAFDRTRSLAEAVGDVKEVINNLQVKPPINW